MGRRLGADVSFNLRLSRLSTWRTLASLGIWCIKSDESLRQVRDFSDKSQPIVYTLFLSFTHPQPCYVSALLKVAFSSSSVPSPHTLQPQYRMCRFRPQPDTIGREKRSRMSMIAHCWIFCTELLPSTDNTMTPTKSSSVR